MQYVEKLRATVESLLFITNEPLTSSQIAELAEIEEDDVLDVLDWLQEDYSDASKGIGVMKLGDGYIMAIKQDYLPYVEKLYRPQMSTLSMAALETLAIIAYKQPVTRGEVELIRGVKADKIVQNLIAKELIEEKGRKDAPGRPILYGTTRKFLQYFNIESLDQLPENKLLQLDPAEAESLVADELELLEIER
ncbi:MAG: SMC-Scp complex subunit ScpB [Peptococcaceae bacterium]|nr:SMC-Scp complex subunit ScpB [Peptococcaceae bacterium]MBQ2013736.1 SMC-Scp complex subunit ScpB [Peptococcaceae bacterium]MBQ2035315.1 SMC-Scp complex subunit ScpB [Peptococcaceae bacterium]MBQ5701957.1 SMC-Scp complex subunit ScpB [Peptococcaceae bacterium]MBQ5858663.1 SMC-Scp complex subunit ScpB [Peptococcaceae bacterium]